MSNLYLQIQGIKGSVSAQGYEGWIGLSAANFMGERRIKMHMGTAADRDMSVPHFSEVEIVKQLDVASNGLFQALHQGKNLADVHLHLCTDSGQALAKYTLSNVLIARHEHYLNNHGLPSEVLRLNYTKIQVSYIARDADGKQVSQAVSAYDLATMS